MGLEHRPTQCERILKMFQLAEGDWIDGMTFLRLDMPITQYHARIWELQRRGHKFDSEFIEGKNWKKYRLIPEPTQQSMIL